MIYLQGVLIGLAITYVHIAGQFYRADQQIHEELASLYLATGIKPNYFKDLLESFIWPISLIRFAIDEARGNNA